MQQVYILTLMERALFVLDSAAPWRQWKYNMKIKQGIEANTLVRQESSTVPFLLAQGKQ